MIVPTNPISNIAVLTGVPLDSTYNNTLSFGDSSSQHAYFAGKIKYINSLATPTKKPWTFRVPWVADNLYDCNYVMYQDTTYGSKWFYGFITSIVFVNPNCTEITIELDVMQTWYFDYTLNACYVEREHTLTDNLGEHLIAEPIGTGEMVSEAPQSPDYMADQRAIVLYAQDDGVGEGTIGGLFTGLTILSAPLSGAGGGAILDLLQSLESEGKANNVVATYIMPNAFYTTGATAEVKNYVVPKQQTSLGSYTPRNKKLLSYPYNKLSVYNTQGGNHDYRYEYFSSGVCSFRLACAMGTTPEVVCIPVNYNNQPSAYDDVIVLSGWPQFSWKCDTYRTWLAINGNKVSDELMGRAVSNDASYNILDVMGDVPAPIIGNPLGSISQKARETRQALMSPNQAHGSSASNTMVAIRAKNFYFEQVHTREDYAKSIDDFFDMFGYEVDVVKVPNRTGRPSWNYVKTRGCSAAGSIPFDDIAKIKSIYDRGITFWHNNNVGDYSQNNSV